MAFTPDISKRTIFFMGHFKTLLAGLCPRDSKLLTKEFNGVLGVEYLRILLNEAEAAELSPAAQMAIHFRILNSLPTLKREDIDNFYGTVVAKCQNLIKTSNLAFDDYDIEEAIAEINPMMATTAARIKRYITDHKAPDIAIPDEEPLTSDIDEIGAMLGKQLYLYLSSLEPEKARCHALLIQGKHGCISQFGLMGPGKTYFNYAIRFYLQSLERTKDRAIIERHLVAAARLYLSGGKPLELSTAFDMVADDTAPTTPSSPIVYTSLSTLPFLESPSGFRSTSASAAAAVGMVPETFASPSAFLV